MKCGNHLADGSRAEDHIRIQDQERRVFASLPPADVYPARIPKVRPGGYASHACVAAHEIDGRV
jgi:hypothetical protein